MDSILSGVSVLMVFLGVFVNLYHREADLLVQVPKPSSDEILKRKALIRSLGVLLFIKAIPLTIAVSIVSLVLLPTTISIVASSRLNVLHFDILNTLYIMINVSIFILSAIIASIAVRVGARYRECR